MLIPEKELEFDILVNLVRELSSCTDFDDNKSIYMREFTFFDYSNDHILNVTRFNMDRFVDVIDRIDRFSISFFDYAEWWYYSKYAPNMSNNPNNIARYYCSRNTGPAWNLCREVAGSSIGTIKSEKIGPVTCFVEKIKNTLLKYYEEYNGRKSLVNRGSDYMLWQFRYEPYNP